LFCSFDADHFAEVQDEFRQELALLVQSIMESVIALRVPLVVHVSHGKRWGNLSTDFEGEAENVVVQSSYFSRDSLGLQHSV
jgi:hypothetical protein